MTKGQRSAIRRAITRLENAAYEDVFKGTIPAGESEYAAGCYAAVEQEFARARECLMALIERYAK